MKAFMRLIKKHLFFITAFVVFITTIFYFGNVNFDSSARKSGTNYWRHDCNSNNVHSMMEYTLSRVVVENEASHNYVFHPNDMEVDSSETAVVRLKYSECSNMKENSATSVASGVIVSDHVIATAAHCVYDLTEGFYDKLDVEIVDENGGVIASYKPRYIHIPYYFVINTDGDFGPHPVYDYALIYVESDLSSYGKFNIGFTTDEFLNAEAEVNKVKISGFPGSFNDGLIPENYVKGKRYMAEGNVLPIPPKTTTDRLIYYNADTGNGHSGSPIYVEETYTVEGKTYTNKILLAVHYGGYGFPSNYNFGVRIQPEQALFYMGNKYLTA